MTERPTKHERAQNTNLERRRSARVVLADRTDLHVRVDADRRRRPGRTRRRRHRRRWRGRRRCRRRGVGDRRSRRTARLQRRFERRHRRSSNSKISFIIKNRIASYKSEQRRRAEHGRQRSTLRRRRYARRRRRRTAPQFVGWLVDVCNVVSRKRHTQC